MKLKYVAQTKLSYRIFAMYSSSFFSLENPIKIPPIIRKDSNISSPIEFWLNRKKPVSANNPLSAMAKTFVVSMLSICRSVQTAAVAMTSAGRNKNHPIILNFDGNKKLDFISVNFNDCSNVKFILHIDM